MIGFLIRRLGQSLLLLFIVSMIGFAILHLAPGGPLSQFAAGGDMTQADLDRIAKVPGLKVVTKGYEGLTYQLVVEINHRREELADLKVRQAIAHAIDKDFVVKTVFLGYAETATGPVPKNDRQFYTADVPTYDFDVAKANALLDEAGYKRGDDGTRFALKLLPAPYFNETKQFGDYLRQALAAIGIDAEIVNNDSAAHMKAVYTDHAFDLAVGPPVFRGDPAISTTILVQSGIPDGVPFSNQGGYKNAVLDALITKASETLDASARTELYKTFQKKVVEDLPLINVAEWGEGLFGAEAAAQRYFRKSAARLTPAEAARLAGALPNPLLRNPGRPSRALQSAAGRVQRRMVQLGPLGNCALPD